MKSRPLSYVEADTTFHRLDPRTKFLFLLTMTILTLSFPDAILNLIFLGALIFVSFRYKIIGSTLATLRLLFIWPLAFFIYNSAFHILIPILRGSLPFVKGIAISFATPIRVVNLFTIVSIFIVVLESLTWLQPSLK